MILGPALSGALSEIVERRPFDPIEYLANYLYKYAENKKNERKVMILVYLKFLIS
jgi:hypothetical protein